MKPEQDLKGKQDKNRLGNSINNSFGDTTDEVNKKIKKTKNKFKLIF